MTQNAQIFRKNLMNLMHSQGKLQADIAKHLGISTACVSNWVHGLHMPRGDRLTDLSDYFGVSPNSFFSDDGIVNVRHDSVTEERLLRGFRMLTPEGKEKLFERMDELKHLYWYSSEKVL